MARNYNGGTIFEKNQNKKVEDDFDNLDSESSGEDMMRGLGSTKGAGGIQKQESTVFFKGFGTKVFAEDDDGFSKQV